MLVQIKQAVSPCAVHRALHLFRKRCRCLCHLILSRRTRVLPLSVCWPLHCKICDVSRTVGQCLRRREHANKEANFCTAKAKERGARDPLPPYKGHKGAKYGIPDSGGRRIDDGALRGNHRGLFQTARMVKANLNEEVN